jgi:cobalt-zinc-cadmium efflux system protein
VSISEHKQSGHHNHAHGMAKKTLRLAFFLTIIILCAGLTGGFLANSLALLSDAGHIVTDLFALGLAWFAVVQAERPADERRTFGYHRVGILAALLNAVTLIIIAIAISWEAIQRFQHPEPVQPLIMFGSAGIAIAVNLFIAFGLQKDEHNLNVRAATLHVLSDIGASVGVIIAGIVILVTGWTIVDPLLSVGIAVLVAFGSWRLLHETINILLEATPKSVCIADLVKDMQQVEVVRDVHDLHVWSITSDMSALSCHVMIDDLPPSNSSPILHSLTGMLNEKYQIGHTTIQFECSPRKMCCEGLYCRMEAPLEHECEHDDMPVKKDHALRRM